MQVYGILFGIDKVLKACEVQATCKFLVREEHTSFLHRNCYIPLIERQICFPLLVANGADVFGGCDFSLQNHRREVIVDPGIVNVFDTVYQRTPGKSGDTLICEGVRPDEPWRKRKSQFERRM